MKDLAHPVSLLLNLVLVVLLALIAWGQFANRPPLPTAGHVAVLLNGGVAYYGKPVRRSGGFLELADVYYVRQVQNEETKEVSTVLVKRGQEVHGPQRMVIPMTSILFMEPVAPDSEIGSKIAAGS